MARFKKVPVAELVIDHNYQRPLDESRVARMVSDFRPAMLGALEVSRHNGTCAVFDGQHRLAVVKALGHETVPCLVHENLNRAEEADLFYRLQRDRKAIHPIQAFRARCVAGDEAAIEMKTLAKEAGFSIDFHRDATTISAIRALERIYARGVLAETLELLWLWAGDEGATDGMFMDGLSLLQAGYGHRIGNTEREKLRSVSAAVVVRNATSRQIRVVGNSGRNRAPFVLIELRKVADLHGSARGVKRRKRSAAA